MRLHFRGPSHRTSRLRHSAPAGRRRCRGEQGPPAKAVSRRMRRHLHNPARNMIRLRRLRSDHRCCRGGQTTGSKSAWVRDATAAGLAARGQCNLGTPADLQAVDARHPPVRSLPLSRVCGLIGYSPNGSAPHPVRFRRSSCNRPWQ